MLLLLFTVCENKFLMETLQTDRNRIKLGKEQIYDLYLLTFRQEDVSSH